jgi:hypothetical protein
MHLFCIQISTPNVYNNIYSVFFCEKQSEIVYLQSERNKLDIYGIVNIFMISKSIIRKSVTLPKEDFLFKIRLQIKKKIM